METQMITLEQFGVINIWTYIAGLIFIIIIPGPNSMFVLKTSASHGVLGGYKAAAGCFLGDAILIFLAYIGVASVIKASPILFTLVRFMGALYLLYLGIKIIQENFFSKDKDVAESLSVRGNVFRKSLTLSLTNPKSIMFYVSFFVQFINFSYPHAAVPYLILATILEVLSFTYMTTLIFGGVSMSKFFKSRKQLTKFGNGIVGLFFMGFAARLASLTS